MLIIFPLIKSAKANTIPNSDPVTGATFNIYAIAEPIRDILDMPTTKLITKFGSKTFPNCSKVSIPTFDNISLLNKYIKILAIVKTTTSFKIKPKAISNLLFPSLLAIGKVSLME